MSSGPSTRATLTRLPAAQSGPLTRHTVSSIRTVPRPLVIAVSTVNTRPMNASVRRLRNDGSLPGQISGQGGSQGLENVIQAGDGRSPP